MHCAAQSITQLDEPNTGVLAHCCGHHVHCQTPPNRRRHAWSSLPGGPADVGAPSGSVKRRPAERPSSGCSSSSSASSAPTRSQRFQRFQHCKVSPKPPVPSPAPKQPGRAWTGGTNPGPRDHRGGPTTSSLDPSPGEECGRGDAGKMGMTPVDFFTYASLPQGKGKPKKQRGGLLSGFLLTTRPCTS